MSQFIVHILSRARLKLGHLSDKPHDPKDSKI